jgi:hypothetical protein
MAKKILKDNIRGRITNGNRNYTFEDVDRGVIEPLFPETKDKSYSGLKQNRIRIETEDEFPDQLPTAGLFPYPIDEDDFIGEFETKKNLYLTFAHAYNKLMRRTNYLLQQNETLKAEIEKLKNK